jgi:hypothetical protein
MIDAKEVKPSEIMAVILARIEKLNPKLNAFCTITQDSVMAQARQADKAMVKEKSHGLLFGLPVSIKDLILTKGIRTTFASKMHENFIPDQDDVPLFQLIPDLLQSLDQVDGRDGVGIRVIGPLIVSRKRGILRDDAGIGGLGGDQNFALQIDEIGEHFRGVHVHVNGLVGVGTHLVRDGLGEGVAISGFRWGQSSLFWPGLRADSAMRRSASLARSITASLGPVSVQ